MRKSTFLIMGILLTGILMVPVMSDRDPSYFDQWRPTNNGLGCHDFGVTNTRVSGRLTFNMPMVSVKPGETFSLRTGVSGFTGTVSSGDLFVGFNVLDGDNALFLTETAAGYVHMTGTESTDTLETTFTAPDTPGTYTLYAYAVTGDTSYFDYITGVVPVIVQDGSVGSGNVEGVINHLVNIAEPALGGYRWVETDKASDNVYKPGMIKGAASIGNFLLDVYEEKVRSSLFKGLNNEETMIPLKYATGAGDWIVAIASENESGYYWYKTYDENNDPSTTTVHLPYYEGVAGIASYLMRLYRITHNSTYADYAMGALNYLINVAYDTTGYAWNEDYGQGPDKLSTRWSKGSPGIGSVFLEAYRLSHNSTFRDVAMGLYTWLDSVKQTNTDGAFWYRYASDSTSGVYLGRWHGVAGVASFLIDLYEVTGDAGVKTLLFSALDYVVGQKEDDGKGGIWWENAVGSGEHQSGWSRGGAGIGSVLLRADAIDPTKGYTALLDPILTHYQEYAIPTGDGWMWEDAINTKDDALSQRRIRTAVGHGGAGIGIFFLQVYQATGNGKFLEAANMVSKAFNYLAFDNGAGLSWNKSDEETYVDHNVYYGITGVATFFLELANKGDYDAYITAKKATDYLMSVKEADSNGYKWVEDTEAGSGYKSGVLKGAAGNAMELLHMYQKEQTQLFLGGLTPNATEMYLDAAAKAMVWLEAVAEPMNGGMAWYEIYDGSNANATNNIKTSYYAGAAGIADIFTRVSQYTGDPHLMDVAEEVANTLIQNADTTTGYAWGETFDSTDLSTRWTFGGPGIGTFMINLYQQTGNETYLNVAKGIATWLQSVKQTDSDGDYWYKIADDSSSGIFLGRWHGVMGVANFLIDLFLVTGDDTYMAQATSGIDWVIAHTTIDGDTASWENALGGGEYMSGFSRGVAGISSVLLRAYLVHGNETYMDYIKMGLNWYEANAVDGVEGWAWIDSNYNTRIATASGHGSAGVIQFATELFEATRMPEAYKLMYNAQVYLDSISMESNGLISWYKSTNEQYVPTTMYYGVAGIAFALLDYSDFFNMAPTVNITLDDSAADTVKVTIDAIDDIGIDTVNVSVDGGAFVTVDSLEYSIDTSSMTPGDHTVKVKVTDVGGLEADVEKTFTIPEPTTTTTTTTEPPTTTSEETETKDSPLFFLPVLMAIVAIPILRRRR